MSTSRLNGQGSRSTLASTLALASARWKHTWFLLVIITIGLVAAVVIVSAVPLFEDVMNTAALRHELRARSDSAEIEFQATTLGLSSSISTDLQTAFAKLIKENLGSLAHPTQFSIVSSDYTFASPAQTTQTLFLYGTSMQQAASHFELLQGHLAQITAAQHDEIEVMMTPDSAQKLGLKSGDIFPLNLTFTLKLASIIQGDTQPVPQTQTITARLAGLFQVNAPDIAYWHGQTFKHTDMSTSTNGSTPGLYTLLVPNESLLAIADNLATRYQTVTNLDQRQATVFYSGPTFHWYYQLDTSRITIDQLGTLVNDCAALFANYTSFYGSLGESSHYLFPAFPYLSATHLSSSLLPDEKGPGNLERLRSRIDVVQVPAMVLVIQIVLLILFFISLMISLLIESQASAIALFRSRGASSGQIFGALFIHCLMLGVVALGLGVPLTILVVVSLTQHLLPLDAQDALTLITNDPWQAMGQILWYAVGVLFVMLLAMAVAVYFAARMDVLALRRDAARTTRRPLWQRLNLDIFAGIVALVGYGISLYLNNIKNQLQSDAHTLVITPLSVIAPFFLVIGCLLLLLRLFPLLLRLGAGLALRGRGAVSVLALVQIARSPRQSVRMTMLLILSSTFLLFTVVYQATQSQRIQDLSTYLISADFSGDLQNFADQSSQAEVTRSYQAIPGVISASLGLSEIGLGGTADLPMHLLAVDSATFGDTVVWSSPEVAQAGKSLLKQLAGRRPQASEGKVVPVVVDTNTLNQLGLQIGSALRVTFARTLALNCVIIGVIERIPSINDTAQFDDNGNAIPEGGILFDYQTYTAIFINQAQGTVDPPALNSVWLHTKDDAASLTSVRTALATMNVANVIDRRVVLDALNTDPLYLILSGTLALGSSAALLLALIGNLLASWLSARMRVTNVVLLRALGSTPRQVVSMLTWEQAIIYLTGILLGVGIGTFIVRAVIPSLLLTDLNTDVGNSQFYAQQAAFPAHLVMPFSLLLLALALVVIYGVALTLMVRIVSQPSLSQALRLDED